MVKPVAILMKRILYRGGIASFDIPGSWVEEHQPEGGASFFEDLPDSGTLRLNVLSFGSDGNVAGEEIVSRLVRERGFFPLDPGLALKRYVKTVPEDGESLKVYYWEVAVPVNSSSARLVIFSFTILASQGVDLYYQNQIALLDQCIRSGTFSREPGLVSPNKR